MDAQQFAQGMEQVSDYFGRQYDEAEGFWTISVKALNRLHGNEWVKYLEERGFTETREDFVERYLQMVLGSRKLSQPQFLERVGERIKTNAPLIDYVQKRDLNSSTENADHSAGAAYCWQLPPRVMDLPDDEDDVPEDFDDLTFGDFRG